MKLRNVTLAGIFLLLAFVVGMAGATENGTINATANETSTVTATTTETVTITATATDAGLADVEGADECIFGPGHALHGLEIAFENIDETFTYNASEKLGKQVAHARKRLTEARAALERNDTEAANIALEEYTAKMESISESNGNDSGLANAEQMIAKHAMVLKNLLDSHPGNKGLERAYSNSQALIGKFEEKVNRMENRKNETGEVLNIRAKTIGNNTQVDVELRFNSDNTSNQTIAQEINDKLQLSIEAINTSLTVENADEGNLSTDLQAEATIENNASSVEANYRFPLNDTVDRVAIVSGIYDKLSALSVADILNVLKITENPEQAIQESKKEENRGNNGDQNVEKQGNSAGRSQNR